MEEKVMEAAAEALLFAMGEAIPVRDIAQVLEQDTEDVRRMLRRMMLRYDEEGRGIQIIELEDAFENMGAQLIREVAAKTNDVAGDGTTTATVLAQAMVNEGMKNLAAGANPIVLRKGMKKATDVAVEAVAGMSSKVESKERIANVAAISAGDIEVGEMVADAMEKVSDKYTEGSSKRSF